MYITLIVISKGNLGSVFRAVAAFQGFSLRYWCKSAEKMSEILMKTSSWKEAGDQMIKEISKIEYAMEILPDELFLPLSKTLSAGGYAAEEIRLRAGKPLTLTVKGKNLFVTKEGSLTELPKSCITVKRSQVEYTYLKAFGNSLHSFQREITGGYASISGGCRAGFCGTAVLDRDKDYSVENVKDISSVNIRIARELIGCAEGFYRDFFGGGLRSLLIAGAPSCGKTTFLRDLTRLLGGAFRVSLIDERGEIAACFNGIPQNDVGELTDVFNCYNKYEGIMTAVRVMSPQILVCDEIGSEEDLRALEYCINSGVKLCASCHGDSLSAALKRKTIAQLVDREAFSGAVLLGCGEERGKVIDVMYLGGENA